MYAISDTLAFTALLTSYSSIFDGSAVEFNLVITNEGDGLVFLHVAYESFIDDSLKSDYWLILAFCSKISRGGGDLRIIVC